MSGIGADLLLFHARGPSTCTWTDTQFQGEPLQRGAKCKGSGKNLEIFDRNRRLSWKWYEIGS